MHVGRFSIATFLKNDILRATHIWLVYKAYFSQLLEEQEKVYKLNLKLIDDARRAVFYRYISKKRYS